MFKKMIFAFVGLFCLTSNLFAYTFTEDFLKGFYWEVFPIKLKVLMNDDGTSTNLLELVKAAEAKWESEANINLWDVQSVTSYGSNDNVVRWSGSFARETGYDPVSTLAVTIRYSEGTYMVKTQIILNQGISYLVQNFASMLEKTLVHEIGHTIGMGHSEDTAAIMAPMIGETKELEYDDISGLGSLLDETIGRQESGYVSKNSEPLSSETSSAIGNCGSVAYAGESGQNQNDGGFFLSALFGIFVGILFKLPSYLLSYQEKRKKIHLNE